MPTKFLVVVDVQNCFITGGSFAENTITKQNTESPLLAGTLTYASNLQLSITQMEEICKLMDINDSFVFTRDLHPRLHFSLAVNSPTQKIAPNFLGVFPKHCRDINRLCDRKNIINKNVFDDSKYSTISQYVTKFGSYMPDLVRDTLLDRIPDKKIIGTNLSFLYYAMPMPYANVINNLENMENVIGFNKNNKVSQNGEPDYLKNNKNIIIPEPLKITNAITTNNKLKNKTAIELTKGQYCNYESYSAFNYHWKFEQSQTSNGKISVSKTPLLIEMKNSTGLFEYILTRYMFHPSSDNTIEITSCGLAGDICVIDTVVQGLLMWNIVYKPLMENPINVIFNYSFAGTLFSGLHSNHIPQKPSLESEPKINLAMQLFILRLNDVTSILNPALLPLITFNILNYAGNNIGSISYNNGFIFNKIYSNHNLN
jgi:hypothetical protein